MARANTSKRASKPSSSRRRKAKRPTAASRVSQVAIGAVAGLTEVKPPDPKALERRSEMIGLIIIGLTLLFGAALVTFSPADMDVIHGGRSGSEDVQNIIGPVGARIADLLLQLMGIGAFALDALLLTVGVRTLLGRDVVPALRTIAGGLGASIGGLMVVHLIARGLRVRPMGHEAAGFVGSAVAEFTRAFVSTTGTALVGLMVLVTSISALSGRPLVRLAAAATLRYLQRIGLASKAQLSARVDATRQEWHDRRAARAEEKLAAAEAERLQEEERLEAEVEQPADAEQPVAWDPDTGLYQVSDADEPVALPDTRPSKSHAAVTAEPRAADKSFPAGTNIAPSDDIIPTKARLQRAEMSHLQATPAEPRRRATGAVPSA
ncbi:MAG: DNA translocase FtsK 4TM domain-containing protein, partial [Myxococcales bacterium]|nr:DNA translocase FtsK 4TM domain-containing protein [Myxococcales bacterium]